MRFEQIPNLMMMEKSEFSTVETIEEILSLIKEKTLNQLETKEEFLMEFPNPIYSVMRLDYLAESPKEMDYQLLVDLYKEEKGIKMKNSYNKLNKKGRFWFWWFASCNFAILVFLVIMSLLTYTIFKQQKQLEQQQSTISKLKRENDNNTASILRLVAYLENVGG